MALFTKTNVDNRFSFQLESVGHYHNKIPYRHKTDFHFQHISQKSSMSFCVTRHTEIIDITGHTSLVMWLRKSPYSFLVITVCNFIIMLSHN